MALQKDAEQPTLQKTLSAELLAYELGNPLPLCDRLLKHEAPATLCGNDLGRLCSSVLHLCQ